MLVIDVPNIAKNVIIGIDCIERDESLIALNARAIVLLLNTAATRVKFQAIAMILKIKKPFNNLL